MFLDNGRVSLVLFVAVLFLAPAAQTRQPAVSVLSQIRADQEGFLSKASIVSAGPADGRQSWRATLASDGQTHDASIETEDGSGPTQRNYRFNIAAYELDKLLGLEFVPTTVERLVSGRSASVIWWVDDTAMNELERRRKTIDPPDLVRWREQTDAVRVFDALISNTYRSTSPGLYLNSVWDNLLITRSWRIWIIDHTAAFRTRKELEDPETLTRCPRAILTKMRQIGRADFDLTLRKYLSSDRLDALEIRRALLVRHFDRQIAAQGEAAVLYDLRPGR